MKNLLKEGIDINSRNKLGITPLYTAVFHKRVQLVSYLIKRKADVNVADHEGLAPLHVAALENFAGLTELFLTEGA